MAPNETGSPGDDRIHASYAIRSDEEKENVATFVESGGLLNGVEQVHNKSTPLRQWFGRRDEAVVTGRLWGADFPFSIRKVAGRSTDVPPIPDIGRVFS
jgi:hypothetical protein